MAKPGVMLYFDIRPSIKRLTTEEKAQLFEAILDYGEFGAIPGFDDRLGIVWDFVQPRLDRDSELYGHKVAQRQYAVYVREVRKRESAPIPFNEWSALSEGEKNRLLSDDTGSYPTSTTTSTTASTSTTTTTSTTASASTPASAPTSTPASTPTKNMADKPPKREQFSPPSIQDVAEYCQERGYRIDAEAFVAYYDSVGWMIGKKKMKSWKSALVTWAKRNHGGDTQQQADTGYVLAPLEDPWEVAMRDPEKRKAAGYD